MNRVVFWEGFIRFTVVDLTPISGFHPCKTVPEKYLFQNYIVKHYNAALSYTILCEYLLFGATTDHINNLINFAHIKIT